MRGRNRREGVWVRVQSKKGLRLSCSRKKREKKVAACVVAGRRRHTRFALVWWARRGV